WAPAIMQELGHTTEWRKRAPPFVGFSDLARIGALERSPIDRCFDAIFPTATRGPEATCDASDQRLGALSTLASDTCCGSAARSSTRGCASARPPTPPASAARAPQAAPNRPACSC